MTELNDSVVVDVETIYFGGEEYHVKTGIGPVSVIVYGDRDKPGLLTYPDLALNYMSCFQGLFFLPEAASLLLHNFCIYHISPPGHELGAASISPDDPVPSAEDLADQILEVLNFFRLDSVLCMGVTAGAHILTQFAVHFLPKSDLKVKYKERVMGLILVSPLCKAPSWKEWLYNKVMANLLYFYGMCSPLKDYLLKRYFSLELIGDAEDPESDIVRACRKLLDERQSHNVLRFLEAMNERSDISDGLKKLKCRTLIFVGDESPFYSHAMHMISKLDKRCSALVEVQHCGSMVTEEQPYAMLVPLEDFLMVYGFNRHFSSSDPSESLHSPRSVSSCISPELLSPESMGLNLKPIRTRRISMEDDDQVYYIESQCDW